MRVCVCVCVGARHVMDNLGGKFPETAVGLMGIPGACVCVGARHVMDNLGGKFPETAVGLMGIPGVCVCVVGFVCACVRACVYVHA